MIAVIGCVNSFLSSKLAEYAREASMRTLRTGKIERIIKELKQPGRIAILDMEWEDLQQRGALKQLVNIARISGNEVVCLCPNQEEDLKKLAKACRANEVFLRYDLATSFRTYLGDPARFD